MKRTPNYEISKRELSDYLNDRMGTHYEIFEKSKIERSPPRYTKNQLRMAMTSPKDKQINSMHTIKE